MARDRLRAGVLSGVAGYVDAAGLLSLAAMFPAHITGELVSEAVAISATHHEPLGPRLWVLPCFVLAVAAAAAVARLERRAGRAPIPSLLALVALGLAGFTLSGVAAHWFPGAAWLARFGAYAAVAAMGFQNAMMRDSLVGSAPTTFMTGNLTQLVIELVDHVLTFGGRPGIMGDVQRSVSRARLKTAAIALTAFLASAALGAFLTRAFGAASAALPTLGVALLSWQAFRERRSKNAVQEPAASQVGMRRPTPIQRPLGTHARPESGTRFKAVRLGDAAPESDDDEKAASGGS